MGKIYLKPCLPLITALICGMTSCIDNDYDLSDIDTTVRVEVQDLVVPINIDKITLDNILNIKEGDRLQVVNGVYAVMEDGTFSSSDITINNFQFPAPTIDPSVIDIYPEGVNGVHGMNQNLPESFTYKIQTLKDVGFHAENVPTNIVSVEKLGGSLSFTIRISLPKLGQLMKAATLDNVILQLPTGLEITEPPVDDFNYDKGSGEFIINGSVQPDSNGELNLTFGVSEINVQQMVNYHPESQIMDLNTQVGIINADVTVDLRQLPPSIDTSDLVPATLRVDYDFSDMAINAFTGSVQYNVEGMNVSDVNLNDLPKILTQGETSLGIANPQIFLTLNNPLNDYGVYASAGITINPIRDNQAGPSYSLDNGYFEIGRPSNQSGQYYYLLCPEQGNAMNFPEFPDPTYVGYHSLSNILEGSGIPQALRITFDNPGLPVQTVDNFPLGRTFGHIEGKYKFVAPLQFTDGSTVVYSNKDDGWSSEDLDAVTIERLEVNLNVTSELPIELNFTGYPIDVNGNRINGVNIEGATIQANAQKQNVTIYITGEVKKLDGIVFEARGYSVGAQAPLNPEMSIYVDHVRPCVSGYYEKEL